MKKNKVKKTKSMKIDSVAACMYMELKIHSLSVERVDDVCYRKCSIGLTIGVARGCSGCTCTPQGCEKNFFRLNLLEKCECTPQDEVHPPARARVNF